MLWFKWHRSTNIYSETTEVGSLFLVIIVAINEMYRLTLDTKQVYNITNQNHSI